MKNITRILVALLVLLTIGLAACGTKAEALEDTTWVLESYGGPVNLQAVLEGTEITALFDSAKGQVDGSAGCNGYFGGYEAKGKELSISHLASTEMWCALPEGVMEQEQEYLTVLQTAESYQIQDGQLHLTCGQQVLVFRRK